MLRSATSKRTKLQLACAVVVLAAVSWPSTSVFAANGDQACTSLVGRIVSIQGTLELRKPNQSTWSPVTRLDTPICQGDLLHTGPNSRAALVVLPEKFIRLDQNSAITISMAGNQTVVEFFQNDSSPKDALGTSCGAGYFITRYPRDFKVRTKFLNAAVEGTEFLVGNDCAANTVAVFEGRVNAQSTVDTNDRYVLKPGESMSAGEGQPSTLKLMVRPADAVQWALYYPPLSEDRLAGTSQDCTALPADQQSSCLVQRAEGLLRVGRADDAETALSSSFALAPRNADATALASIISLVKNDKNNALILAKRATQFDASSYRAWTALSYAQQADFKLEDALASAERAVQLYPNSSPARSRVAELLMSLGRTRAAQRAAQAAVDANPRDSRAHSVLGFVYLTQIDTAKARLEFQAAIEYDSSDPLARLGLGLAMIRRGELVAGREQIEIAVTLDPTNALIRSYMGKAYFEEDTGPRDRLAASQLGMSKQLDPSDPTPWFYDALLKSTENRPVEALQDVQRSIELNDERAVYRSRLLLDEDLAARSASLARVYSDLNFQQLAEVEGWNSLATDPTNFSAHRFLADSYLGEPRHEIGRLSELLQSQLWQPLNLQPLQPQIGETGLSITNGLGPARTSYDEYTNLFVRDGLHVYANGIVGANVTFGNDLVISGLEGPLSFSLGQFHYQSEGYRRNNDQTRDLYNAFVQFAISPDTSVQAEYRTQQSDFGDLALRFDPNRFNTDERHVQTVDTARVGIRHDFSASTQMIAVILGQQSTDDQHTVLRTPSGPFTLETTINGSTRQSAGVGEVQLVNRWDNFRLISGAGYFNSENTGTAKVTSRLLRPSPLPPLVRAPTTRPVDENANQTSAYTYATYNWSTLAATLGLSVNYYESLAAGGAQVNPKLGLIWKASPSTTIRFAAFRSLRRDLAFNQTIEPTQVAGFNQFYDDPAAADAKRIGIGIDQTFSRTLFGGIEVSKRNISIPVSGAANAQNRGQAREWLDRAYLYWTPTERVGLRAEYQYDQRERDSNLLLSGFDYRYLRTQRVPLQASWFTSSGWTASVTTTWTDQSGKFSDTIAQRNFAGHDEFWLVDAEVRYRLPRRYGMVSVGVKNLFDTHFNFQEPDPTNPTVYPERFVYLKLEASF